MPKGRMEETDSSGATRAMNGQITGRLREFACRLRQAAESGTGEAELRKQKEEMLAQVYKMLSIHLGTPPASFDWQWRDKDKEFHRREAITPQAFYEEFVGMDLDDYVCLIHDPRPHHEFNQTYTVKFLGNVVGGEPVLYLNVDLDTMKQAAIDQLKQGESVWHGCDVGKYLDRESGVMDLNLFEYDLVYGNDISLNKAERLMYGHSMMTHAMVFTGVDLDGDGKPTKWRVENSWSEKTGDKGFYLMTDPWFDEFNYEVVVHKKFVSAETINALEKEPVELDPWDPMGSLA